MILQMNTIHPKIFLEELSKCVGSVSAILSDGTECDVRSMLPAGKAKRNIPTKLTLNIQRPGDYMRLACFAIGDV